MLKKILFFVLLTACQNQEADLQEAKKLLENGKTEQAITLLKNLPNNAEALNLSGIAYLESNKNEEALPFFNEAIKLDNQKYKFFYNRGNTYMKLNQPDEALADYEQALQLDPTVADLYLNKGAALFALNRLKEALASLNKAAEMNPNDKNVFFNRGKTYIMLEDYQKASDDLHKAVHLDEKFAKAHYFLAQAEIFLNQKATPETCGHLQKALELGYTDAKELLDKNCQ